MRDVMLLLHFIGFTMSMGAGIANLFVAASIKDMQQDERVKFMLKLRNIGYMGLTGIILLVLSGGYLITPYWSIISTMPLLITKLILVLILIVVVVIMDLRWRGAVKNNGGPDLAALPKLGRLAFPLGLAIMILAVLTFH